MQEHHQPTILIVYRGSCSFIEHLAYTINVIADGCPLLLLIVQQVNGIKEFQIVNLTKDGEQLVVVNVVADDSQVDIRAGTVVAL